MSTSPVGSRLAVALPDMQPLLQGKSFDPGREVMFVFTLGRMVKSPDSWMCNFIMEAINKNKSCHPLRQIIFTTSNFIKKPSMDPVSI